jgi:dTDP-4-dehydrorhamnose reductase
MGARPTLLLTGASGLLGAALARHAFERFRVVAAVRSGAPPWLERGDRKVACDLEEAGAAARLVAACEPQLVVHAAALSSLAACQSDPARARRINVDATRELARAAARCGAWLLFVSSDQVFDGERRGGERPGGGPADGARYGEDDAPRPVNVYGRTKLEGEEAVRAAGGEALVVRTALVLGRAPDRRSGAVESLLAAPAGATVRLFHDEWRTPVSAPDLARVIGAAASRRSVGLVHVAGPDRVDRLTLGRRIAAAFGRDGGGAPLRFEAASQSEAGHPRPRDVSLRCERLAALGLPAPHSLEHALQELALDSSRDAGRSDARAARL